MRLGLGGGGRILRGGVNVGRGGVRGGVGVGPFSISGGGGGRRSAGWDAAGGGLLALCAFAAIVLLVVGMLVGAGPILISGIGLFLMYEPHHYTEFMNSLRVAVVGEPNQTRTNLSDEKIRRRVLMLVGALCTFLFAVNVVLSFTLSGTRADGGYGETEWADFVLSALLVNLLFAVPLFFGSVVIARVLSEGTRSAGIYLTVDLDDVSTDASEVAMGSAHLLVGSLATEVYGFFVVAFVGRLVLNDDSFSLSAFDLGSVIAFVVLTMLMIRLVRTRVLDGLTGMMAVLAIGVPVVAGKLGGFEQIGYGGLITSIGFVIQMLGSLGVIIALVMARREILWRPRISMQIWTVAGTIAGACCALSSVFVGFESGGRNFAMILVRLFVVAAFGVVAYCATATTPRLAAAGATGGFLVAFLLLASPSGWVIGTGWSITGSKPLLIVGFVASAVASIAGWLEYARNRRAEFV